MLDELFTKLADQLDAIRIRNYSGSDIEPLDDMLSRFNLEMCKTFDELKKLQAENQALRDELGKYKKQVASDDKYLDKASFIELERDQLRNELEALKGTTMGVDLSKDYINKIKADALNDLISSKSANVTIEGTEWPVIYVEDAHTYANKLEQDND